MRCVLVSNFMDTGTWTLRCHRCNKTFEVELKPTERIIKYAQQIPCPHCNMKPAEAKGSPTLWHHIIAFRAMTPKLGRGFEERITESNWAARGFLILVASLTAKEHKGIFLLCHYFARRKKRINSNPSTL